MGGGAVSSINMTLADRDKAEGIVLAAPTALDAVTAAGIPLNQVEQEFLANIPPTVWTQLRSQILSVYESGGTPSLAIENGDSYGVTPRRSFTGDAGLVLTGPVPPGTDLSSA